MIYIYGLKCPIEKTIRYVGKSIDPRKRLLGHISSALTYQYNHRTSRWIRKLMSRSLRPELVILHTVVAGERWQDIEREFISSAASRGWRLTNSTAGGEGLDYLDPADTLAWRNKLSKTNKKIWSTPERRQEAKERAIAVHSNPEIVERRRASLLAAHQRPDVKIRMTAARNATAARSDVQQKKSETTKINWADLSASAKRRAALSSDETRAMMSGAAQNRWADPVKSKALLEVFANPESRAKRAESAKRRSTPEYRAMMAAKTKANWASGSRKKHKRRSDATGEPTCL